jgi:outer membrane biosynthesis protein TonB
MIPQTKERKVQNSGKVNLLISFIFHAVLLLGLFYFAAREGLLGKHLEKISVELVHKEKPPVAPPKPPEPPRVPPPTLPPVQTAPKPVDTTPKPAAPPPETTPVVVQAPTVLADFDFEGGKELISSRDQKQVFKSILESVFYQKWNRPEDMEDLKYVAEVDVAIGRDGTISDPHYVKTSGNAAWDKTVQEAIAAVPRVAEKVPTNFPPRVTIRFDVTEETTESVFP